MCKKRLLLHYWEKPDLMSGRQQPTKLRELSPEEYALWDRFVYSTEAGTLFHTSRWAQVMERLTGRAFKILALFQDETLAGGMLFWPKKQFGLRVITMMPATTYQGILAGEPKSGRISTKISSHQNIVEKITQFLTEQYDFIQIPLAPGITDVRPYVWAGFEAEPVYTYSFPIRPMDELEFQFNRTLRQNLRTARKKGLYTEPSAEIHPLLDFVAHSYAEHGKRPPLSAAQMEPFFRDIMESGLGRIYYLKKEEDILAGFLALHDSKAVYALFMGIAPDQRGQNYNKYIYASVMEREEFSGLRWDFLGANEPDLETLKRSFGGELQTFYRVSFYKNAAVKWLYRLRRKHHLQQRNLRGKR